MCICPDRPICASLVGAVLAVAEGERVMVPCRVLADPATTSFRWAFNSSDNNVSVNKILRCVLSSCLASMAGHGVF